MWEPQLTENDVALEGEPAGHAFALNPAPAKKKARKANIYYKPARISEKASRQEPGLQSCQNCLGVERSSLTGLIGQELGTVQGPEAAKDCDSSVAIVGCECSLQDTHAFYTIPRIGRCTSRHGTRTRQSWMLAART